MDEINKLARELLTEQFKMNMAKSGELPSEAMVAQWRPRCLAVAKAIIEATK